MPKFTYHFSFGNSSVGPVGMVFYVTVEQEKEDKEEALKLLREAAADTDFDYDIASPSIASTDQIHVKGARVYLNLAALTVEDIEDVVEGD